MRRRDGIKRELVSRADQRVLRWFGHLEEWMSTDGQKGVDGRSRLMAEEIQII